MKSIRLDHALVMRSLVDSRARARDTIKRGHVMVNGQVEIKPSKLVTFQENIIINDPAAPYVARSALKLIAALDAFSFDISDRICLDIGASTGGFTQVLLERGAKRVHAVDVGHKQLHPSLASNPHVVVHEGMNARYIKPSDINDEAISMIVIDVSFISLKLILPSVLRLVRNNAYAAILIKPQFEVGKELLGKNGVVRCSMEIERVTDEIKLCVDSELGWQTIGIIPSPITGLKGNHEMLLGALYQPDE